VSGGSHAAGIALLGGGGGCLAVGTGLYFAWVNPAWAEVDQANRDPASVTRREADELSQRYSLARAVTTGLLGLGIAGAATGALVEITNVGVTPWGLSVSGRF
jgi:hypothetical protein